MSAKQFHLGDILSITTGRLVSPRHMDGVYDILNFMTGDDLMTHQLGRAADECKPYLMDQFPWAEEAGKALIANIEAHPNNKAVSQEENCAIWLNDLLIRYGEHHDVRPMPMDDHDVIDPIEELKRMRPDLPIITIDATEQDTPSPYGDITWKAGDDA